MRDVIVYCLNCDERLPMLPLFRGEGTTKSKVISCRKCPAQYSRQFIREADPQLWEKTRHDRSFEMTENGIIYLKYGMGLDPELERLKK